MRHYQLSQVPGEEGKPLIIYGAGAHGQVVAEAAAAAGWQVLGFLDDAPPAEHVGEWPLIQADQVVQQRASVIVAVGDNLARRRITGDSLSAHWTLANVIHPTAWVSPTAKLGRGIFIGPQALVNAHAQIDDGVIINSGAIVEHDCCLGAYSHIAPGAALGGGVHVGGLSLVGLGACVLPKVHIGEHCRIGAGAAVHRPVADRITVAGVPARPLSREK